DLLVYESRKDARPEFRCVLAQHASHSRFQTGRLLESVQPGLYGRSEVRNRHRDRSAESSHPLRADLRPAQHAPGRRRCRPRSVPNNVIPAGRLDPVAANILKLAPITDPITNTLFNNIPAIGTCCPVFDQTTIGMKGDHIINDKHRLAAYFNYEARQRNNSPGGRWGVPPGTPTGVYQLQDTPG